MTGARMLGHTGVGGCTCRDCYGPGGDRDTRTAKRREARQVARDIADDLSPDPDQPDPRTDPK